MIAPWLGKRALFKTCKRLTTAAAARSQSRSNVATETAPTIEIAIESARLLGLRGKQPYEPAAVRQAYEQLLHAPLEAGYSDDAIRKRLQILDQLVSEVGGVPAGKDNTAVPSLVDWTTIPALLALAQQVGEYNLVLEAGEAYVGDTRDNDLRRDTLLSMSLAYCGLAKEALDADQLALGCFRLERAADTLERGGQPTLAPSLAIEIGAALQSLLPHSILDQLRHTAPLQPSQDVSDERPSAASAGTQSATDGQQTAHSNRASALAALKRCLDSKDLKLADGQGGMSMDSAYMRKALACLSPPELIALQPWRALAVSWVRGAPKPRWAYEDILYPVALAYVLQGFLTERPDQIVIADELLSTLQDAYSVASDRAVCAALLADLDSAHILMLRTKQGGPEAQLSDPSVPGDHRLAAYVGLSHLERRNMLDFVCANLGVTQPPLDSTAGILAFARRWLAGTLALFPAHQAVSTIELDAYFESESVQRAIAAADLDNTRGVRSAPFGLLTALRQAPGRVAGMLAHLQPWRDDTAASAGGSSQASVKRKLKELVRRYGAASNNSTASSGAAMTSWPYTYLAAGACVLAACWAIAQRDPPPNKLLLEVKGAAASAKAQHGREALTCIADITRFLEQWNRVKQEAMGPAHDTSHLDQILRGSVLAQWQDKVSYYKEQGWHYVYNLHDIRVNRWRTLGDSTVEAIVTMDEAADLKTSDGTKQDHYRGAYQVKYELRRVSGRWKIADINILEPAPGIAP